MTDFRSHRHYALSEKYKGGVNWQKHRTYPKQKNNTNKP